MNKIMLKKDVADVNCFPQESQNSFSSECDLKWSFKLFLVLNLFEPQTGHKVYASISWINWQENKLNIDLKNRQN